MYKCRRTCRKCSFLHKVKCISAGEPVVSLASSIKSMYKCWLTCCKCSFLHKVKCISAGEPVVSVASSIQSNVYGKCRRTCRKCSFLHNVKWISAGEPALIKFHWQSLKLFIKYWRVHLFFFKNPELLEEWQDGTKGGTVYEAYGQSETVSNEEGGGHRYLKKK
jgi:acetone carboxylase gamma subunit